jgi:hypothetical protein
MLLKKNSNEGHNVGIEEIKLESFVFVVNSVRK